MLLYGVSEKENGYGSETESKEIHTDVHPHPRAVRPCLAYRLWREEPPRDVVGAFPNVIKKFYEDG
jgi:hypothetical protein